MKTLSEYALVALGLAAVIVGVTWPHAAAFGHSVVSHIDPLFSMWRLAWFAHAVSEGVPIADANMFFPEPGTFLLSDAMFLQGAMALPALWAGLPLPAVYNALLLAGMMTSGLALHHVARTFAVPPLPAFAGAVVFTVAPFRIEHLMHLELQWIAPALMAGAALRRLVVAPGWRPAASLAVWVTLQFLACVYYAVFLVPLVAVVLIVAFGAMPRWRATAGYGVLALVLAAVLASPAAALYLRQSERTGGRTADEVGFYSATPINYLASPRDNALYGSTSDAWGASERRLFPGVVALAAAAMGLWSRRRTLVWIGLVIVVSAATLSFGLNAWPYRILYENWSLWQGLRVPARFGIYVLAGLGLLAALGVEWMLARWPLRPRVAVAIVIAALCVEYWSPQTQLYRLDVTPPVYQFLARSPEGVVLELPFSPPLSRRDGPSASADLAADYIYWSTRHWRPLVNGYSGYHPPSYERTIEALAGFPDATAMAQLAATRVRYVLIHATYLPQGATAYMLDRLSHHPGARPLGTYHDWIGPTHVFELMPTP